LVNGDDANTAKLAKDFKGKVQKFGVSDHKIFGEGAHLKKNENLDFEAKDVKLDGLNGSSFSSIINHQSSIINLPLPGIYHIYDALAALASASLLDLPVHQLTDPLKNYAPAFGRVEKLPLGYVSEGKESYAYIFLIKNPAGATQVFETIAPNIKTNDTLLLALNDNLADGTDVSWIWDAEFEKLLPLSSRAKESLTYLKRGDLPRIVKTRLEHSREIASSSATPRNDVIVSGTRAQDIALRLKYAGIDPKNITIEPDLEKALSKAKTNLKGNLFILPTYTAMLELQSILAKAGIKKNYWEDV